MGHDRQYFPENDAPVFQGQIPGRQQLKIKLFSALIYGDPQQVFGVEGDWGSGKTSLLHELFHDLEGHCEPNARYQEPRRDDSYVPPHTHVRTIWFEAWRYQHDPAPVVALLQEIRSQLGNGLKFFNTAKKLSEVSVRGALNSMEDVTKKIGFQASKIQKAGEDWERRNLAVALPSHHIREHLNKAIRQLIGKKKPLDKNGRNLSPRVVIMIDDLDRCEPETAYRLLEGIKIYLDLESCIFVLGINAREIHLAIASCLAKCYSDDENENRSELLYRAHEYVEKLCSTMWRVPVPNSEERSTYAKRLLHDGSKSNVMMQSFSDECAKLFQKFDCLPANPRKIKALCGRLRVLAGHYPELHALEPESRDNALRAAIIVASLYQFHPEVYRILQDKPQFYQEILKWCRNPGLKSSHKSLLHLHQSHKLEGDAHAETPGTNRIPSDLYADPSDLRVLRIQQLILQTDPLTRSDLTPFLNI